MPNTSSYPRLTGVGPVATGADLSANESIPSIDLGTIVRDQFGNAYKYVNNGEASTALARGNAVMQKAAATVTTTVSSDTAGLVITSASSAFTAGQYAGYYCYVYNGTGEGQLRRIVGNTATTLTLELALTTALGGTSTLAIFNPNVVNVATGSGQTVCMGIAIGAITAGNYGWVQVGGVAEVKSQAVATANIAVKAGGTTAGEVTVMANGDDMFDANLVGYSLVAQTNVDKSVPVKLNIAY